MTRPAGSSAWRSGRIEVARAANLVRFDGLLKRIPSAWLWTVVLVPSDAGRAAIEWPALRRSPYSTVRPSGSPPRDAPGLTPGGAEVEEPIGGDDPEGELLGVVEEQGGGSVRSAREYPG